MVKPYEHPVEDSLSGNQRRVEIAAILLQNGWDVFVRQLGLLEIIPGGWRQRLNNKENQDNDAKAPPLPVPQTLK